MMVHQTKFQAADRSVQAGLGGASRAGPGMTRAEVVGTTPSAGEDKIYVSRYRRCGSVSHVINDDSAWASELGITPYCDLTRDCRRETVGDVERDKASVATEQGIHASV